MFHLCDKYMSSFIKCSPFTEEAIEVYIKENKRQVDFLSISEFQKLSEAFIEKYKENLNWTMICVYQKLSEDFIERNKKYVDFFSLSKYQHLSENFIRKYFYKLEPEYIFKHQYLSDNFINYVLNDVNSELLRDLYLSYIKNNWIYKTAEEKKQAVIDTREYECHDDYFIAYKAIRHDRYSLFNFQYKYEKGGIYESWCDCSDNENSFGLSVGTNQYAKDYSPYLGPAKLIVKCKVNYKDVGRIVHNGDKIRCFKIELLN